MLCPVCQTPQSTHASLCSTCGAALHPATTQAHVGEQRIVTLLVGELIGLKALIDTPAPDQAAALIEECLNKLHSVIASYGGTSIPTADQRLMLVFGAPQANEDDPVRAVRAALGALTALQRFNLDQTTNLDMGFGVATGLVVYAPHQHPAVIGMPVEIAQRLAAAAQRGDVLIDAATQRQITALFSSEALDAALLGQHQLPFDAFKLEGFRSHPERLRGLHGHASPLVGREAELSTLLALSDVTSAQAVLLRGDAGIGKSRLLSEWHQQLGLKGWLRWIEAQCAAYGTELAYHLLRDIVRGLAGISPQATPAESRALLYGFAARVGAGAELATLVHLLALPVEARHQQRLNALDPVALQAEYVQTLQQLLTHAARRGRLVLVLEDLHWADAASVEVLLRLIPRLTQLPLLLVLTTRLEGYADGGRLIEALRSQWTLHEMTLETLSPAAAQLLVSNLLTIDLLAEDVRAAILERANGNPFFVEEIIRSLIDQGMIVPGQDRWQASAALQVADIPLQLQGLLLGRIDRLDAPTQHVLRTAAVVGREFTRPVMRAVLKLEPAALDAALDTLVEVGMLDQLGPDEYQFHHSLLQDVAYASLLPAERQQIHAAVAPVLLELYAERQEEMAATLARHFDQAQQPEAMRLWLLAGDAAYRAYALREAIQAYEAALAVAERHGLDLDRVAVLFRLGRALELRGQLSEALAFYAREADHAAANGLPALELAAQVELAKVYALPHQLQSRAAAEDFLARAAAVAPQAQSTALDARRFWVAMLMDIYGGSSAQARIAGEQSLELARQLADSEQLAYTLHDLHRVYNGLDLPQLAEAAVTEAADLWRSLGNQPMLADALCSMADRVLSRMELPNPEALAQEALAISERIDNSWTIAYASVLLAEMAALRGELGRALQMAAQAVQFSQRSGPMLVYARGGLFQVVMLLALGAQEQAERLLREIDVSRVEDAFRHYFVARADMLKARLAFMRGGDVTVTLERLQREWGAHTEQPMRATIYDLQRLNAEQLLRNGQAQAALTALEQYLQEPLSGYQRFGLLRWQVAALSELQRWNDAQTLLHAIRRDFPVPPDAHTAWRLGLLAARIASALNEPALVQAERQAALDLVARLADTLSDPALRTTFWALPEVQELQNMPTTRRRKA